MSVRPNRGPGSGGPGEYRPAAGPSPAAVSDFDRVGDIVSGLLSASPEGGEYDNARRVAQAWARVVGVDAAANSQPRSMRAGRLVVATSSAGWAQALQEREGEVIAKLAVEVGEGVVRAATFRPAGWDPCAGADAPRPLEADPAAWDPGAAGVGGAPTAEVRRRAGLRRELTPDERAAVQEVRRIAVDPDLGDRISQAMRASLERG